MSVTNRMTDRARQVLRLAKKEALRFASPRIEPEHLLLALVAEGEGVAFHVIDHLEVNCDQLRRALQELSPEVTTVPIAEPVQSAATIQLLDSANGEAVDLAHHYIGTEHLLLAVTRVESGLCREVLRTVGLDPKTIRNEVYEILGHSERIEPE